MQSHTFALAVATLALTVAATAQAPCPARGMTLAVHGGRLGDQFSVDMTGSPSAIGFLGLDLAPGPTVTPIGTVCLGLTPAVSTQLFQFDAAGAASFVRQLPPVAAFEGITIDFGGVAIDASQPGGFALSNGGAFTTRQPRMFFVAPGSSTPFGTTPGSVAALNMINETVPFSQALTTSVRDAVFVRERGWLVMLLGNGSLLGLDGSTGATVLNVTLSGTPASAARIAAAPGGDQLLMITTGTAPSPFGGGTPGALHVVSLPTGAVTASVALAAGNPDALIVAPGTTLAYLRLANGIAPIDWQAAAALPTVALPVAFGGLVDWQIANGMLYVLHSGTAPGPFGGTSQPAALTGIVIGPQTVLFTNPLTMAVPVSMLRAGPGTTGPSVYVYGSTAGTLAEFQQFTGTPTTTVALGSGIAAMELSTFGSEWLLLCTGGGCGGPALRSMIAFTNIVATVGPVPATVQSVVAVSPSTGYSKACLVFGSNTAAPFLTDLATGTFGSTPLPFSSSVFTVVSD
jgi:hypothetical protein